MQSHGQFYRWMQEAVRRGGTSRTLYTPDNTLSRRGVLERADRRARELSSLGIRAGQVVGVSLGNVSEFIVLLIALSKLGAITRLIDPANGDRTLVNALTRIQTSCVIRRPRGMENAPLSYPNGYKLTSRRKLAGTLISIDSLASTDEIPTMPPEFAECELIVEAPCSDGLTRDIGRTAADLRAIGEAAASVLAVEQSPRLLCSAPLCVPRFFDPVILGWMASDYSLVMAEDPSLREALRLCRDDEPLVAVDSLASLLELARSLRLAGTTRQIIPILPQALIPVSAAVPLEPAFLNPARQLLLLEEIGVLGSRLMRRNEIFHPAAGIEFLPGPHKRGQPAEILASFCEHSRCVPSPIPGAVGSPVVAGRSHMHTGYLGKFSKKGLAEVLGRSDDLVNLEGRRASLRTVEEALLAHRRITWAKPVLVEDPDGDSVLRVKYCATGETAVDDIEEFAVGVLAPYLVPRRFERLSEPEGGEFDAS